MALGRLWMASALVATLVQGQDPHAHHGHAPTPTEGGWVRYQHKSAGFSLEHPADWKVVGEKGTVAVHIEHPTKPVHLFAAAYTMAEGTLQDFADQKFGVQREIFRPIGPAHALEGVGWSGLVEDAEAAQGEERARRRILCARHENMFVSLTLYNDPRDEALPEKDCERLFASLRFDARPPAPVPSPGQPH